MLLVMSYSSAYHLSGEMGQKKTVCGRIAVINNNLATDSNIYLNNEILLIILNMTVSPCTVHDLRSRTTYRNKSPTKRVNIRECCNAT
jgi:hypothetical protein